MPSTLPYTNEETVKIDLAYQEMLASVKTNMDDADRSNLDKAYNMALEAHAHQRRKTGEPYIYHPIEVARICADEIGLGPTALISALLHDTVEDTSVTLENIKNTFGPKIAMIVNGLTKLDGLYNVASPQAENFKKVLLTLTTDVRVVLIKMADRLHNMRTLGAMPRHKQLKIAAETSYIYAPLAHRLGLYNIKTEYLDLCMKITDREAYKDIANKLQATKASRNQYIKTFINPLEQALKKELGFSFRITGRPKSIYSIYQKIKNKKVPFEEIYDLFAIRIIIDCPIKEEKKCCWQAYSIITDVHRPIPERLKDWITNPKSNGYESLHTTVVASDGRYVEIQIRTERMDDIAERGFAAHWKYKGVSSQPDVYDEWLDSVREILEHSEGDAIEFLSDFKTNLFQEEVYVYTPDGDLKILPKGATALDFAFSIHSDVGYHAAALKANNKLVPMGYILENGDQIQVITNKNQKPNESWLKMVVTGKARSKIRSSMKEERRKLGEFGKESLQRKFKNLKIPFEENVDILVKYYDFKSRVDLYFEIANGNINPSDIPKLFVIVQNRLVEIDEGPVEEKQAPKVVDLIEHNKKLRDELKPRLLINGQPAEQYEYSMANCCNPVPGDDVFAYTTVNSGLKIHRTTCPNATHLMANFGYRIMKAEWIHAGRSSFITDLLITGIDEGVGVIERLTNKVSSELGLNIRSFYIDGHEGYFEGKISLLVKNKDQVMKAIKVLKSLPGISSVTRSEN